MSLTSIRNAHVTRSAMVNWVGKPASTKLAAVIPFQILQVATLRRMYGEKYPGYIKPFPYKTRRLGAIGNCFENTTKYISPEQTKVISVEGPPGVGKHALAKRLAKEFDLLYVPGVHDDDLWIQRFNGFDVRQLNEAMPYGAKAMDFKELYSTNDPIDIGRSARFQNNVLETRLLQYCYSCLHMLSTGQGFVTVRSPYSDSVFCDTMLRMGWISAEYADWHRDVTYRLANELMAPHLVIYLDVPVKDALQTIKKREKEDPKFVGGKNLDEKFLKTLEERYRRWLCEQPERDGEILQLDWREDATESEMDVVLEAITDFQFVAEDAESLKFWDWKMIMKEDCAGSKRLLYSNPDGVFNLVYDTMNWPMLATEFFLTIEDYDERLRIMEMHDMGRYRSSPMNVGLAETLMNPLL